MRLGDELRKARLARKLTASQVAAATRMKVQVVDAIEREDFSGIAAPIYSKGFIRLYAEYVGLDAKPLIDDFVNRVLAPHPSETVEETSVVEPAGAARVAVSAPKAEPEEKTVVTRRAPVVPQQPAAPAPAVETVPQLDLFSQTASRAPAAVANTEEAPRSPASSASQLDVPEVPPARWKEHRFAGSWRQIAGRATDGLASVGNGLSAVVKGVSRKIRFRSGSPEASSTGDLGDIRARRMAAPTGVLPWISIVAGVIIVLVFAVSVAYRYMHRGARTTAPVETISIMETFRPVVEPPAPYID